MKNIGIFDDSSENIRAAKTAGLNVLLYSGYQALLSWVTTALHDDAGEGA